MYTMSFKINILWVSPNNILKTILKCCMLHIKCLVTIRIILSKRYKTVRGARILWQLTKPFLFPVRVLS